MCCDVDYNHIGILTARYKTQLRTVRNVLFSKSPFISNNVLRETYVEASKLKNIYTGVDVVRGHAPFPPSNLA